MAPLAMSCPMTEDSKPGTCCLARSEFGARWLKACCKRSAEDTIAAGSYNCGSRYCWECSKSAFNRWLNALGTTQLQELLLVVP